MKLRPLQDRVLIRPIERESTSPGGIIIPDTAKEKPMEGEVLAAGPGARVAEGCAQHVYLLRAAHHGGARDQVRRRADECPQGVRRSVQVGICAVFRRGVRRGVRSGG